MGLKIFCQAKDTLTKTKEQHMDWEKIVTNSTYDIGYKANIQNRKRAQ